MKKLILLLLILVNSSVATEGQYSLIGKTIPPYPSECESRGGAMVGPEYGWHHNVCENISIFYFSKFKKRENKKAYWVVVHELVISPSFSYEEELSPFCSYKEYHSSQLLVLGSWDAEKSKIGIYVPTQIRKAWLFDVKSEKIVEIPTESVKCEGYSAD
jgi:hypothetical protein